MLQAALALVAFLGLLGFNPSAQAEVAGVGRDIKANPSEYWGHGYIIGRPVRGSPTGVFFTTFELIVNQGGFTDTNLYIGSNVEMSTESDEVLEQFQKLNSDHLYVFEYIHKYPLNPEIEKSRLQVTKIYEAVEFLKQFSAEAEIKSVAAGTPYQGSQTARGVRKGRIVDVERFGMTMNFCVFELNTGGLAQSGSGTSEALMEFSVMDEGVCRWVESKIALGKDVEVDYAQDLIEAWQPSDYFANAISIVETGETVTVPKNAAADIEAIKQQLLNDPEFLKELKEKLN